MTRQEAFPHEVSHGLRTPNEGLNQSNLNCLGRPWLITQPVQTLFLFKSIWIRPQRSQGCQKMRQDPLNMPFEVYCANIAPERHKLPKIIKIGNKMSKTTCFLRHFQIFFNFGAILAHQISNCMFIGSWRIF